MPLRSMDSRATGSVLEQPPQVGLLLGERHLVVAAQQPADEAAVALLEHRQLGAVAGAAHVEAGDDAALGERQVGEVVGRARRSSLGAGQDQLVGVEAVALVDEAALELLLEVLERQRVELLDDAPGGRSAPTRSSVGMCGASLAAALHVAAEEAAQPPRHVLPAVVRVLAQLLGGDLPEDAAPAERRGAAGELTVRAQDERGRAR